MTVMSTPACSKAMAAEWRLCGVQHNRHTCAMTLVRSGVGPGVIALWLGHANLRSVERYIHADMGIKERALARTTPIGSSSRRYQPPDRLMAFLEALGGDYAEQS